MEIIFLNKNSVSEDQVLVGFRQIKAFSLELRVGLPRSNCVEMRKLQSIRLCHFLFKSRMSLVDEKGSTLLLCSLISHLMICKR